MIEIPFFAAYVSVIAPRLRNGDHDGERKLQSIHDEKFKRIVKHGGIRAGGVYDGKNFIHVLVPENTAFHRLLPRKHSVDVSANGINFAVVENKTVWMSAFPAWGGIG